MDLDLDFLEMLKQQVGSYGNSDGGHTKELHPSINPTHLTDIPSLTQFPEFKSEYNENPTPPLTNNDTSSPESSHSNGHNDKDRDNDKRKASDDLSDSAQHNTKSVFDCFCSTTLSNHPPGTNNRRSSGSSAENPARNSKANSSNKRKEQNRAAQRAFRERKEKHVKVLEDKVAAQAEENTNLRDLLSRLQQENMTLKQSAFTFQFPPPQPQPQSQPQTQSNKPSFQKSPSPLPQMNNASEYRDTSSINDLNTLSYPGFDDLLSDFGMQNDFMFDQHLAKSPPAPPVHSKHAAAETTMGPPPTILELAEVLADPEERLKCPQVKAKMEQMGIVQSQNEDIDKISPYLIDEIKKMVDLMAKENNESVESVVRNTWKDLGKAPEDCTAESFDLDDLCNQLTAKATCKISNTECQAKFLTALSQRHKSSSD
ncbi:hypothetical protein E3P99_00548 [Wallemia hederae]|uniref:BZIP domain-containing protein n=1 Tax=Wallemia hederae TaxID=1540922 RepID=A0A4T0FUE1_9BASI|nr:hypothetical protein E3P99_00548 [Wallemia hederae]